MVGANDGYQASRMHQAVATAGLLCLLLSLEGMLWVLRSESRIDRGSPEPNLSKFPICDSTRCFGKMAHNQVLHSTLYGALYYTTTL